MPKNISHSSSRLVAGQQCVLRQKGKWVLINTKMFVSVPHIVLSFFLAEKQMRGIKNICEVRTVNRHIVCTDIHWMWWSNMACGTLLKQQGKSYSWHCVHGHPPQLYTLDKNALKGSTNIQTLWVALKMQEISPSWQTVMHTFGGWLVPGSEGLVIQKQVLDCTISAVL